MDYRSIKEAAKRKALTADYVRSILDYNPETGEFRWKERPRDHFKTQRACSIWNSRFAGVSAGSCCGGYRAVRIGYARYYAHILAWLWVTGTWPENEIDHIDGDGVNNRLANLREATSAENQWNRGAQANNTSGIKGVSWSRRAMKWRADIQANGKRNTIGIFESIEDAAAAYGRAARELHGKFARIIGG